MKKTISIQYSSLCISSRLMVFVFVILLFASQSILHAEIQNGSFEFDGLLRNYIVYLPTNYTGAINFPLVIHLHSGGWTAQQDMDYIKLNQVADTYGFIVVYPSAINKRWYSNPDVDDLGFINALIDIMSNRYSIDLERVYACGYSRGGFMAYALAFQLSHRIAAIASVGGGISSLIPESYNPVRPMPILHIHGTADTWVPINGTSDIYSADQTINYWTSFNDCVQADTIILPDLDPTDGCTVEKTTYTSCSDDCNVVYYKVINGGHTWPGAGPPGYSAGNTNQDFNASVEIWNFFSIYDINGLILNPQVVDFNGDFKIDIDDLIILIEYWGQDEPTCDVAPWPSGDGIVDRADLELLMSYWGQLIDDPTLVAHWALDETEGTIAADSTGKYYGTVSGGPLWQPEGGMVDGAIELDGINDYINTPFVLNPADGPFSVFAWIKGGDPGQTIISQADGVNWLCSDILDGTLMTELRGSGRSAGPLKSQTIITDGNWHRIGFVRDGFSRILYVNDVEVAADTQNSMYSSNGVMYIGTGSVLAPGTFFSGLIDDIRIYNRVITP